eukprot:UN25712
MYVYTTLIFLLQCIYAAENQPRKQLHQEYYYDEANAPFVKCGALLDSNVNGGVFYLFLFLLIILSFIFCCTCYWCHLDGCFCDTCGFVIDENDEYEVVGYCCCACFCIPLFLVPLLINFYNCYEHYGFNNLDGSVDDGNQFWWGGPNLNFFTCGDGLGDRWQNVGLDVFS